ncbi:MAG: NADP-dependent oxidoreductase [Bacteroidota bacterium]
MTNKQFVLAKRPVGLPPADTWTLTETPAPEPADGEVLVKTHYISLDPAMRGWMNDVRSYIRPVRIGEVMRAGTVGEVVASKAAPFKPGDFVMGNGGVQAYHVAKPAHLTPIDAKLAPLPTYLGTLGMPGMTAYFGLLEVGQPKEGETVLVSGAAGAVGSVVGQVAKIKGCRVIGIAGGPEKCAYLTDELGYDAAIDYKAGQVKADLKELCPDGVDVYFDNVGGEILDIVLGRLRRKARIVICGAISQYNNTGPVQGPKNYLSLLVHRARMEGLVVFDYADRYHLAAREMAGWMMQGKLKHKETVFEGLENFPEVFLRLFSGEKLGKLVLKV